MTDFGSQLRSALIAGSARPMGGGGGGDGDGPTWLFFVIPPIVFFGALAIVINPRLPWKLNRRMYKNPDAMEPSRAGEWVIRIGALIGMGIAVTLFVMAIVDPS